MLTILPLLSLLSFTIITTINRKRPNYVIKFDHDISDNDDDGDNDNDDNDNGSNTDKKIVGFHNEHVHHTNRYSVSSLVPSLSLSLLSPS